MDGTIYSRPGQAISSNHGISAIQFTGSYQCTQLANRYSYNGQGDPQHGPLKLQQKLYRVSL